MSTASRRTLPNRRRTARGRASRAGRRSAALAAPLALLAFGAAACGGSDAPHPAVPRPSGAAASACRALHARLPARVDGRRRITLSPSSPYTAAWGDPAIELRCGVPLPDKLTPSSAHYNPTAEAAEVNGVSWLLEKRDDGYRFTTTQRTANVELTVPHAYAPEIGALTDLASAVRGSVPETG